MSIVWTDLVQIVLLVLVCVLAVLAIELPDLLYAIISLGGMAVTVGSLFWLLHAPYVAVFQVLVYAGAVVVLFIAAIMLTKRGA